MPQVSCVEKKTDEITVFNYEDQKNQQQMDGIREIDNMLIGDNDMTDKDAIGSHFLRNTEKPSKDAMTMKNSDQEPRLAL